MNKFQKYLEMIGHGLLAKIIKYMDVSLSVYCKLYLLSKF